MLLNLKSNPYYHTESKPEIWDGIAAITVLIGDEFDGPLEDFGVGLEYDDRPVAINKERIFIPFRDRNDLSILSAQS